MSGQGKGSGMNSHETKVHIQKKQRNLPCEKSERDATAVGRVTRVKKKKNNLYKGTFNCKHCAKTRGVTVSEGQACNKTYRIQYRALQILHTSDRSSIPTR